MIDQYLQTLKSEGVEDPAALYQRAQQLVEQFDAESAQ